MADTLTGPGSWRSGLRQVIPILSGGDKRRDGYGQEPGKTDFAIRKVESFSALGLHLAAPFSNDENRPKIETVRAARAGCAQHLPGADPFPIRGDETAIVAKKSGVLRIVVFDHKHVDNAGIYEVVFTITRV